MDLILIGLTILLYFPVLDGPFLFDDYALWRHNSLWEQLKPKANRQPLLQTFKSHRWRDRKLTWLTYYADAKAYNVHSGGWHWTNVWLHASAVVVSRYLFAEFLPYWPAFAAALIVAVHPLSTSAAAYIAGRASVLAALFTLLALLCAMHHLWLLVALFGLAGLASKEEAIVLPMLIAVLIGLRLI